MDVEKTIEFLLRWQAKFSADMEIMKANMAEQAAESCRSARRHEEWMLTLTELVRRHDRDIDTHTEWLEGLSLQTQNISTSMQSVISEMRTGFAQVREQFDAVGERFDEVSERFDAVGERFKETDNKIRATDAQVQRTSESVDRLAALIGRQVPKPPVQ